MLHGSCGLQLRELRQLRHKGLVVGGLQRVLVLQLRGEQCQKGALPHRTAVTIQQSAETIVGAFLEAGAIAFVAITLVLYAALRRVLDVALVMAPLLLATLMTVITCVELGPAINFANIIALPLLLGIGVAFNIYFVVNWRAGLANPLQSSTARAVLFSALTTTVAFGSLALSNHPGTASMGVLLTISLGYTLFTSLFVLPALFAPQVRHPGYNRPPTGA